MERSLTDQEINDLQVQLLGCSRAALMHGRWCCLSRSFVAHCTGQHSSSRKRPRLRGDVLTTAVSAGRRACRVAGPAQGAAEVAPAGAESSAPYSFAVAASCRCQELHSCLQACAALCGLGHMSDTRSSVRGPHTVGCWYKISHRLHVPSHKWNCCAQLLKPSSPLWLMSAYVVRGLCPWAVSCRAARVRGCAQAARLQADLPRTCPAASARLGLCPC